MDLESIYDTLGMFGWHDIMRQFNPAGTGPGPPKYKPCWLEFPPCECGSKFVVPLGCERPDWNDEQEWDLTCLPCKNRWLWRAKLPLARNSD